MKYSNNSSLDPLVFELAKSIDARVCIDLYLWTHPEESQAELARKVFGISPAAFSKALNAKEDYLRPDWCEKFCQLLRETDLSSFEAKFKRILALKSQLDSVDTQKGNYRVSDDMLDHLLTQYRGTTGALLHELKAYRETGMTPSEIEKCETAAE